MTEENWLLQFLAKKDAGLDTGTQNQIEERISHLSLVDIEQMVQVLRSYPKHQEVLLKNYSWNIYDRLFSLSNDEEIENSGGIMKKLLLSSLMFIPTREIQIMIQEKFAFAKSSRELSFLFQTMTITLRLSHEMMHKESVLLDFTLSVLPSFMKKLIELSECSPRSTEFKVEITETIVSTMEDLSTHCSCSNKIKGILTGFLIQFIVKAIVMIPDYQLRTRLLSSISELVLHLWDYHSPVIFFHLLRETDRIKKQQRLKRKQARFYREWSNSDSLQREYTRKEVKVLSKIDEDLLAYLSHYLKEIETTATTQQTDPYRSFWYLSNELWEYIVKNEEDGDFLRYPDLVVSQQLFTLANRFPWSLSGIALITYSILSSSLLSSASSFSSFPPYSPHLIRKLLEGCLPYLLELPLIQSQEALHCFNLIYHWASSTTEESQKYFVPCLVQLQPTNTPTRATSPPPEELPLLLDLIDDELLATYLPKEMIEKDAILPYLSSYTGGLFWQILFHSRLYWKLSQMLITSIVQCPESYLREQSFQSLKKYFSTFEAKSRLFLLLRLIEICPYSQMKALLIDYLKSLAQLTIREQQKQQAPVIDLLARSSSEELDLSSLDSCWTEEIKFPVDAFSSSENLSVWLSNLANEEQLWTSLLSSEDYLTVVHRQYSLEELDRRIYRYSAVSALSNQNGLFWSSLTNHALFYHLPAPEDPMKATLDQILELSEAYNAKVLFVLFIVMKLEISLSDYVIVEGSNRTKEMKISELSIVWSFFLTAEEEKAGKRGVITLSTFFKSFQWLKDHLLILHYWEKWLMGLLQENQKIDGTKKGVHTEEMLKIDLLVTNLQRCMEKIKKLLLLLYYFLQR